MMTRSDFVKRLILLVLQVLLALAAVALLAGARGFKRDSPAVEDVVSVTSAQVCIDGGAPRTVTLPHTLEGLPPQTPVTLTTRVCPRIDDGIYIKTVHTSAEVYLDDQLAFVFGKQQNYPGFMLAPATEIHVIEAHGSGREMELRIEFLSPKTEDTLVLDPPMVGTAKELILERAHNAGIPWVFTLVQLIGGFALMMISACILFIDRKGVLFFWLGLFSLATGSWFYGLNNFSITVSPDTTALYLLCYLGMMTFLIPLTHFLRTTVNFTSSWLLWAVELFFCVSALAAVALQLLGLYPLHRAQYFFLAVLPPALLLLTGCTAWETLRYKNNHAGWLIPLGLGLSVTLIIDLVRGGDSLPGNQFPLFQLAVLFFLFFMGIAAGASVKSSLDLQKQEKQLAFEKQVLDIQTEEQRESSLKIAQNEEILSRQRHDLRHHLAAIQELAGDNPQLQEYLSTLVKKIPARPERFCENTVVNSIISHYSAVCQSQDIRFTAELALPQTGSRDMDSDLCAIFANLLENAAEACGRMTQGERFIRIRCALRGQMLTITMDNSFDGRVSMYAGRFRSAKRNDYGIGLTSIEAIAEEHHGAARFRAEGTVFQSSVYLNLED